MAIFDMFRRQDKTKKLLTNLLEHNADIIQREEGKERPEAEYLAICLILDDLMTRPNGQKGHQELMAIVQSDYPRHFNDVITYLGWVTGKLHLKPEFEVAMKKRHERAA